MTPINRRFYKSYELLGDMVLKQSEIGHCILILNLIYAEAYLKLQPITNIVKRCSMVLKQSEIDHCILILNLICAEAP